MSKHGTKYRYELGCRCDECRTAATTARKRFRDRARSRRSESYLKELRTSREWKQRQHSRCRSCGAETNYNGHLGKPISDICIACSAAGTAFAMRGTGAVTRQALAYLTEPRRFSEVRDHLGISNGHTSSLLVGRLLAYGFVERPRRGVYVLSDVGRQVLE